MKLCASALLATILITGPLEAQESSFRLSVVGNAGWFEPSGSLASTNPRFARAGRKGVVKAGPLIGLGVHARLPSPLPQLRITGNYLLGSDLILEEGTGSHSLGSLSVVTALAEAMLEPFSTGPFAAHVTLGAGIVRYSFPEIDDEDLAHLFHGGQTSPAVSLGLGGSWQIGDLMVVLDARDMISTFDSPPVDSETAPGGTMDEDELQHDLSFSVGLRFPLWPR